MGTFQMSFDMNFWGERGVIARWKLNHIRLVEHVWQDLPERETTPTWHRKFPQQAADRRLCDLRNVSARARQFDPGGLLGARAA